MLIILSSNVLPAFTYAYSQVEKESKIILKEKIYETEQQFFTADIKSSTMYTANNNLENWINSNLNKEEITWKVYYNNITTEVIAPIWSFQEGTILSIVPIKTKKKLKEIKDQLVEQQEEITEESDMVAFDISFLYSWEEVQPIIWKTVQVTFNYWNHKALTQADEDKGKELKVYHLNDKDEDGNKVGNISDIKVEEVEITKSEEWKLTVDAESFSVYTIVTQVAEEWNNSNQLANFEYWEISITRPSWETEWPEWITIMDRNLWAIMTWAWTWANQLSYGYYYQWWNNYWFNKDSFKSSTEKIDVSGKESYSWSTFIASKDYNFLSSWMIKENNSLWSWSFQQWPCPNWWHIPSDNEWNLLIKYYVKNNITNYIRDDIIKSENNIKQFTEYFKLPYAWYITTSYNGKYYSWYIIYQTAINGKWFSASTLWWDKILTVLQLSHKFDWIPIRCFKNEYSTIHNKHKISYNYNWWRWATVVIEVNDGTKISEPEKNPVRKGYIFKWWYNEENNLEYNFDNIVESDLNLYAKRECEENYIFDIESNICKKNNIIKYHPNWWSFSWLNIDKVKEYTYQYSWMDLKPIYNIQIPDRIATEEEWYTWWMFAWWYTKSWDNNDWWEEFDISNPQSTTAYAKWLPFNDLTISIWWQTFTIMDRNLWAEDVAKWTYYWLDNWQENNEVLWFYYQWWNNYWFKNHWEIKSQGNKVQNEETPWWPWNYYYNNIFVRINGNWDTEWNKNLWWWTDLYTDDNFKKWPCPKWYHIPNKYEWQTLRHNFDLNYNKLDNCNNMWNNECFSSIYKLPFAWYLPNYKMEFMYKWYSAYYRTSTPNNNWWNEFNLGNWNIWFNNATTWSPIRCFKNTTESKKLTIKTDNDENDKEYNLKLWDPISNYYQNNAIKKWYKLNWRIYLNSNTKVEDKDTINSDTIIIADWDKNPRYTYDANWWDFWWYNKKIIKYNYEKEKAYIHTPNISDNGNYLWTYANWEEQEIINTITITWAYEITWYITYWFNFDYQSNNSDYLVVRSWIKKIEDIRNDYQTSLFWKIEGFWGARKLFSISWESLTYYLRTYWEKNWPWYWYYSEINWQKYGTNEKIKNPEFIWYDFIWWYETWASEPFNFWTTVTKDKTFYAKWNPHHYTIQFDINWWTWEINDINATYWKEIQLPTVTREGHTFKWWKSEDWIIYNNIIPEWTWVTTEDWVTVTLTAQWELIPAITPSAWGGQSITPAKQETKITEQEHNSADTEEQKTTNTQTKNPTSNTVATEEIKQQVIKVQDKSLTRWEIAIMTNILLEVYPQLVEWKQELDDVTNACTNYADEQNFTKDEKKAITRLCKLSIMWIHNETNEPLEEFLVNNKSTNDEFSKVINRSIETYNEKDLTTIKDALKKLEWDEENVVFGTVYDVFMSIKNIFN